MLQSLVTVSDPANAWTTSKVLTESLRKPDGNPELHALIRDAQRVVLYNRWIIDKAPL